MDIENVAREIVDSAVKIHIALGPGLLESAYQQCLVYELRKRGLKAEAELKLPIYYDDHKLDAAYRIDVLVENCIIVENKCVDAIAPIHVAQMLTYLRMSGCHLGLLLNWKNRLMKDGIQRVAL